MRNTQHPAIKLLSLASLVLTTTVLAQPTPAKLDWWTTQQTLGQTGEFKAGGVFRVALPRENMRVYVGTDRLKTKLAVNPYVAFLNQGNQTLANGELVLTERELPTVTLSLQKDGLWQTSLTKRLPFDSPRLYWLHFMGKGDPVQIAKAIKNALEKTASPVKPLRQRLPPPAPTLELDVPSLNATLGGTGSNVDGILQYNIARWEAISVAGIELPPALGVTSSINLQPSSFGKALLSANLLVLPSEVNTVTRILLENGLSVVDSQNLFLEDYQRFMQLSVYANDDANKLARALKLALDKTNHRR